MCTTEEKVKFIIDKIDELVLYDRLKILRWFKDNTTLKISECRDGCRIDISKFEPEKVDVVYSLIKNMLIVPERFRI